jgi:hypothetical protein
MGRRDRSKAQRQLPCMACIAAETARQQPVRADTATLIGLANAEVHGETRSFESLCPTHRNTYRLIRDAIDGEADLEKKQADAIDLAIASAAAEGRQ